MTATAYQLSLLGIDRAAKSHPAELERCVQIARQLARQGPITMDDVRIAAGLFKSHGRSLNYLGAVMRCAGLKPTGKMVRSTIPATHGNWRREYRL
jgi:hypothetical protein